MGVLRHLLIVLAAALDVRYPEVFQNLLDSLAREKCIREAWGIFRHSNRVAVGTQKYPNHYYNKRKKQETNCTEKKKNKGHEVRAYTLLLFPTAVGLRHFLSSLYG